ncbi:MFS transporter [Mesorhizobium australicum]|uniref:Predicted arabinose efflux permease, MFS family n=1 Tax=Mesorhizobium australicum TaxID=536018 RepID=A0A1X7P462_9HYPH|nr:MFS transporter [Mesorhizobium australicum]SMH45478.1 Predicted arabinose efflux permease, MFS family [Mesorhizobium australicum]
MHAPSNPDGEEHPPLRLLSLAAAIGSISVVGIAIGLGVPLLSVVLEQRGHSATMIGLNTAAAGLASIAAAPIATPLGARFGVVPTLAVSMFVGALSFMGFHYATEFWMWFPLRAVLHIALTVVFILSEYWINVSAPPRRRGMVLGIYATMLSLGFALGPWIFAQIGSQGVRPFAVAFGLVMAGMLPVLLAWRQSPRIPRGGSGDGNRFLRYIWLVPTATAAVFVFGAVETGGFALFPLYASKIGYPEADAALLLSMIGLGNVLFQVPLGMLSDRIGDRRRVLVACAVAGLAGMVLMPFVAQNWTLMAALLLIWGGAVAALYTVGLAHLGSQLHGRDLASANAAFVFCYGVGMLAGPQMIGLGLDAFGPPGFGWTIAAFFAAYLLLIAVRIMRGPARS